jgi:hypothetical protein
MTTNPEAKWRSAKMQHERRALAAICAELPRRVNRLARWSGAIASIVVPLPQVENSRQRQPPAILKAVRRLLTREFHVAILDTIGIGRSAVRFATLRLEQTTGSPFVAWHAKLRPRLFCI